VILVDFKKLKDEELVAKAQKGNREAFDELMYRYEKMVIGTCFKKLRNYQNALDVSQDIFLNLFKAIKTYSGKAKFSTWLYSSTRNACINHFRYKYSKNRNHSFLTDEIEKYEKAHVEDDVLKKIINKEQIEEVKRITKKLSEIQKKIFEKVFFEEYSYNETAQELNVKRNFVRMAICKGRKILKKYRKLKKLKAWKGVI